MRAPLACLALLVAGCAAPSAPGGPASSPSGGGPGPAPWSLGDCAITLHVWLVPLEQLRERTPPEFPPAVLREQGLVDTPLGRLVFYLYDCAVTQRGTGDLGRSLLGLLGVRVVPPEEVAPPEEQPAWATTPWVGVYALTVLGAGPVQEALNLSRVPWRAAEGEVHVEGTPLPEAPMARATVRLDGAQGLDAVMQGTTQVENFSRPERYYHLEGPRVAWLDASFNTTLWETEGRVDYAPGSPWDRAVGQRALDAAVDHHALRGGLVLAWGAGDLGQARPARAGNA